MVVLKSAIRVPVPFYLRLVPFLIQSAGLLIGGAQFVVMN